MPTWVDQKLELESQVRRLEAELSAARDELERKDSHIAELEQKLAGLRLFHPEARGE
jgi:phage shock protein A